MTERPPIIMVGVAAADRASEAIESLQARRGDDHAIVTARAAAVLFQVEEMHNLIHSQGLPIGADVASVLCAGFTALQENFVGLMSAAKIDRNDVAMLMPLLRHDLEEVMTGIKGQGTPGASEGPTA